MSPRRTFQFAALLAPLFLCAFALTLPYSSARLSLIFHGHPFARVVPKEKLDIFQYVHTDNFAYKAVVFSGSKAVGIISQPTGDFAQFQPFSDKNAVDDFYFDPWLGIPMLIAWTFRWWLLLVQVIVLLLWLRMRQKRVQYS